MAYSLPRDNWERLVTAVVKREQIWQLCHQNSFSTIASDYTDITLSFSSVRPVSSLSYQLPVINDSIIEDWEDSSETISQKLFSALRWKKKPKDSDMPEGFVGIPEYDALESFSLPELLIATDNFSKENVIGRGGHGTVYKGLLRDGSVVAVKRLKQQVIELQLEMACLVMHRNVVKLIGFCITQDEQLLVYPFMENGSVASCLRSGTQPTLDWPIRNSIALGVANGLAYLHEECIRGIIHCDVKAGNILLDEDFQAVLSDFTLAKYMDSPDDGSVRGPIGHIATKYLYTHKFTEKDDVFNYGIFLLELITGQNIHHLHQLANNDMVKLLDWVTPIQLMVDPSLEGNFVEEEVDKLFQLVLICTLNDPDERPTMLEVVRMIDGVGYRWKDLFTYSFGRKHYPLNDIPPDTEWIFLKDSSSFSAEELSSFSQ